MGVVAPSDALPVSHDWYAGLLMPAAEAGADSPEEDSVLTRGDRPSALAARLEAAGITYHNIATAAGAGALLLRVGVESVRAEPLGGGEAFVLRAPPLAERRTCEECARLADRGAYEAAVKAYEAFVRSNAGHYQIDDASFAIAQILDEKLFRYAPALEWYGRLVEEYPLSTLSPLARQRIAYIDEHRDHGWQPLARFERVRLHCLAAAGSDPAAREQALEEARAILADFPDSSLAPKIQYWLANQQRLTAPERAAERYRAMISAFPHHPDAADARIEIGETYYDAGLCDESIVAYEEAMEALPDRAGDIEAQLERAYRNQRRGHLAIAGWVVIGMLIALGLLVPPVGVPLRRLRRSALYFAVFALVLLGAAWRIHEQFRSTSEPVLLALSFAAAATWGYPFSRSLASKLFGSRSQLGAELAGVFLGLLFLVAATYVAIYQIDEHHLIVVRL